MSCPHSVCWSLLLFTVYWRWLTVGDVLELWAGTFTHHSPPSSLPPAQFLWLRSPLTTLLSSAAPVLCFTFQAQLSPAQPNSQATYRMVWQENVTNKEPLTLKSPPSIVASTLFRCGLFASFILLSCELSCQTRESLSNKNILSKHFSNKVVRWDVRWW